MKRCQAFFIPRSKDRSSIMIPQKKSCITAKKMTFLPQFALQCKMGSSGCCSGQMWPSAKCAITFLAIPQLISTECYIHHSTAFSATSTKWGHPGAMEVRCGQAPSGQLGSISHNTIIMCTLHFWQCYAPIELDCMLNFWYNPCWTYVQDYISFVYFINCIF